MLVGDCDANVQALCFVFLLQTSLELFSVFVVRHLRCLKLVLTAEQCDTWTSQLVVWVAFLFLKTNNDTPHIVVRMPVQICILLVPP